MNKEQYIVYVHISPNGKRYYGITSKSNPNERWGKCGSGYKDNPYFWNSICKYGWDNFQHIIIIKNISLKSACMLEKYFINKYESYKFDYGFNRDMGGIYGKHSPDTVEKLRSNAKALWDRPGFRDNQVAKHTGIPMSEETKIKISKSLKGRPSPLRGRRLSEEHRLKLMGRPAWITGLTKDTNESVMMISNKLKGRKFTESQKANMSISRIKLFDSGYTPVWYNNGVNEIQIDISKPYTVPEGFKIGRLYTIYVTKDGKSKKIDESQLDLYIQDGWERGRDSKANYNIKKSKQKYIWHYDGLDFINAAELAKYLNSNGYPYIVPSTITDLYNRGFYKSKIYGSLDGKITRTKVCHEN